MNTQNDLQPQDPNVMHCPDILPLFRWKSVFPTDSLPAGISDQQPVLRAAEGYFLVPYRNKKVSADFFVPYKPPVFVETIYQGKSYDNTPDSPVHSGSDVSMLFQNRLSDGSFAYRRSVSVRAMQELLTIQWIPSENFTYRPSGFLSHHTFSFSNQEVHGGIAYTSAHEGLDSWLTY